MGQEPAAPPAEGQEPNGTHEPAPAGETETFDKDYVKSLRAEAAKHRTEAAAARKRAEELENEKLTETERLQKEAEEGRKLGESATTKLRNVNLRDALSEMGFSGNRAKAVARLLSNVEFNDDDEPKNLAQRLKAAEKEYGDIAKPSGSAPSFDGGPRGGPEKPLDMNAAIRRAAGRT
jgi:hypothetical protein